jgi:ADP-heptose:LPS heptosyltransferase
VLVLGANYFTKRIPLTISHKIIKNQPLHCILVGGKDTVDTGQKLNEYLPEKVIDMTGKLTIHESATIIKHAKYVVTGDTGMMHIAAAFKKKIFVLWGNTTKEFGMYPYYGTKTSDRSIHLEVGNLNCRPCSKLGFQKCPKSHFRCMMDQDISVINSG